MFAPTFCIERGVFMIVFRKKRNDEFECKIPNYVVVLVVLILILVVAAVVVKLCPTIISWLQ